MRRITALLLIACFTLLSGCGFNVNMSAKGSDDCLQTDGQKMTVHYLNLSDGKCSIFELPNGECMIIDSGSTNDFPYIYEYLRNLDIHIVDYLVITYADSVHMGGAKKLMQNLKINSMYVPRYIADSALYKSTANAASMIDCEIITSEAGSEILDDDDLSITVASPIMTSYKDSRDYALSVVTSYRKNRILSEGDCGSMSENDMLMSIGSHIKSDVLSVANNGNPITSSPAFLQKVSPKYAVIQSYGAGENLSSEAAEQSLQALGATVLRTDVNGNTVLICDGKSVLAKTEK